MKGTVTKKTYNLDSEMIEKARRLLDAKTDINYEGASGSLNLDQYGDPMSGYGIWGMNATNQIYTVAFYPESLVTSLVTAQSALSARMAMFPGQMIAGVSSRWN